MPIVKIQHFNLGEANSITLKAGQKVMLIQTPKGVYLKMAEKILKIKLPPALLSSLTASSKNLQQPTLQKEIAETSTSQKNLSNPCPPSSPGLHELVSLISSDEDERKSNTNSTERKKRSAANDELTMSSAIPIAGTSINEKN